MKKKLFFVLAVVVVLMMALSACDLSGGSNTGGGSKPDDKKNNDGWTTITSPSATEVYKSFLSGFTSIAGEFSKSKLKTSPKVSVDGAFLVEANKNTFWASVRMNYNNNSPADAMVSMELFPDDKAKADELVFGCYLYKEKIFLQFGETTKFSLDLKASQWAPYFPLDNTDVSLDKLAMFLGATLVSSKDTVGKSRMNGLVEEYNYVLNIDLAKSLKNLLSSSEISKTDLAGYGEIISGVFGVTIDEIKAGEFPKSSLKIDFTTVNMKMSAFNMNLEMDEIKNKSGTVFGDDELKLTMELQKLSIGKDSVSVPFVLDENESNRNQFVYYKDNAFQISFDATVVSDDGQSEVYATQFKAKVFQEDPADNYAFVEVKDHDTGNVLEGMYVYKNIAYIYTLEDSEYKCKVSFPFDLTLAATKTVSNDFVAEEDRKSINWVDALGYLIKNLKVESKSLVFYYDNDFYNHVWVNMYDMLNYFNAKFEEDMLNQPAIKHFADLILNNSAEISFAYDEAFITVLGDNDESLIAIRNMLTSAQPELTFSEISADADDGTIEEVPELGGETVDEE